MQKPRVILQLLDGRKLVIAPLVAPSANTFDHPFAALVPAFDAAERRQVDALANTLMDLGCSEFCCVGSEADELHDSLDAIIEEREAFDVVTTSETDSVEACEYFLFAAGGRQHELLALVSPHAELAALLETLAREGVS